MLVDRDYGPMSVRVQILGGHMRIPVGIYQLAKRTGATVIPAFIPRLPGHRYVTSCPGPIELPDTGDRDADAAEFGRRIAENGSGGTDHGAASTLFAIGGSVRGGFYGTAPNLNPNGNSTLENNGNDVHFEHDFRSVYATVLDQWLGADPSKILGSEFERIPFLQ
jgi:hypothetical protein